MIIIKIFYVFFIRICGNLGGEIFIKKNIGLINVMIFCFDSVLYNVVCFGKGFILIVIVMFFGKIYKYLKYLLFWFNYNNKRNYNEM